MTPLGGGEWLNPNPLGPTDRTMETIILATVALLLFGAKRLPDAARGLGKSLRIFKSGVFRQHQA